MSMVPGRGVQDRAQHAADRSRFEKNRPAAVHEVDTAQCAALVAVGDVAGAAGPRLADVDDLAGDVQGRDRPMVVAPALLPDPGGAQVGEQLRGLRGELGASGFAGTSEDRDDPLALLEGLQPAHRRNLRRGPA
jgi:hypothetical protein